ncbi:nuclear receptor coactivator 6 isoform X3 [Anoplophora glabripennis]|uniref:nuclear receptor coactivator 6 isoform X3 n=1 Tax=Anoplophora glabripennis TaxID=217634 RepID=UPI000C779573|nr:nuclear receptor coactivator 6 isoform X3 [Anoplophora glabripennis]
MAGKPDLSAAPGVQNVVVYVSNDNFAQAYAVGQQNVPQNNHQAVHSSGYPNTSHSMAPVVGPTKTFTDKQVIKPPEYTSNGQVVNSSVQQGGYFAGVISQNGFPQPIVNNISYQNGAVIKNYSNSEVLSGERQAGPGRPDIKVRDECDNRDSYVEPGYVTVMGAEVPSQSVRCDSVRSETAESSCSSLSSADEGLVVVQNQPPEMVVYDPSVSVRPAGVVLAVGPPPIPQQTQNSSSVVGTLNTSQQPFVTVPYGWKRLFNNGSIIYISPSNTALSSPEQVKEYLLTEGTCKCGLECHFKYDSVFNFDPKVVSKPWVLSPDTNTGDLTKLCNHKRKIIAMASLDCKPPDPNIKLRKEYNVKRKKRKIGLPYAGGVSVSQILAHREKLALNQHSFNKEAIGNSPQVWPQSPVNGPQLVSNRLQGYPESPQNHHLVRCQDQAGHRVMAGSPVVVGDGTMMVQQPSPQSNISHQQVPQNQQIPQMSPANPTSVNIQSHQIIGPNGQIINVQGSMNQGHNQPVNHLPHSNNGGVVIQGQNVVQVQQQQQHQQPQQQRIFINGQPNEPSGPGRPNIQMIPVSISNQQHNIINQHRPDVQQRPQQQPHVHFYNGPQQYSPVQQYDSSKNIRPFNQVMNGFRPQAMQSHPSNPMIPTSVQVQHQQHQQKIQWQQRMQQSMNQQQPQQNQVPMNQASPQPNQHNPTNVYERVPPLHQHTPSPTVWQEDIKRKKVKLGKIVKNRPYHVMENCQLSHAPCPNIDVRQIPNESRAVIINQLPHNSQSSSSPSFMEDPSGYLAQQTALLNNTINRQTGANGCSGYVCNSPVTSLQSPQQNMVPITNSQTNEVPLPSNMVLSQMKPHVHSVTNRTNQNVVKSPQMSHNIVMSPQFGQIQMQPSMADSSALPEQHQQYAHCQGCVADSMQQQNQFVMKDPNQMKIQGHSRPSSTPGTPSSSGASDDPVTSSTYSEKPSNQTSPDSRPIQGGTVSTSNVSPVDGMQSDPPTPNPHPPTPPRIPDTSQIINTSMPFVVYSQPNQMQHLQINQHKEMGMNNYQNQNQAVPKQDGMCCSHSHPSSGIHASRMSTVYPSGIVTTMASGRTVGSNTITSVLAGRANTATVSINSPSSVTGSSTPTSTPGQNMPALQTQAITVNVSKSPLEMVQSVVSSIQVPQSQHHVLSSSAQSSPQMSPQIIKHSPTGLPPGHILVSSGGQLIMASTGNGQGGVMAPPPPKIMGSQSGMPPISVSPMVTNVTASVAQVIPAVAQQVLGQQTVLVNALPAPFVLQPGVTMTMDGMTVGQNMQLPHLVAGNVIQQQIQIDNGDPRRAPLLSPETKKKGKKRKMSSQTVASMLHIAAQQNSGVVMSQQGFPQQIQMAHSPQGITTGPVMQALTIVPSKTGGPPQIVMNSQAMANANLGTQQLITNSQPAQQINLLQPVNLINGTTGVVQNFPAIQQFIVPNLGGMVMNPDGTATILQDTSNLGMQLQIQNVNGQNVLTPVQNSSMFNGGQSILAAGPAGMVIRAPNSQGKIIQQQQHSPGAQFLSPNGGQFVVNGTQFSGQLSPLVASVSPSQQVTFSTSPQQIRPNNSMQPAQQEYIQMNGQMGQTLMVPCSPAANIAVSSSNQQNTTFVQQNTTIVQQQTTMVANNQQLQNFQQQNNQQNQQNVARTATLNLDQQNYIISSNDNKQMQAVVVQQRESPQNSLNYRHSVSTQTAVNQNAQSVTTNTFCQTSTISAGSPPDTTTLSPLASGGQSPPTADTTTHTGSTDDGLSPAPSNCSAGCSDINMQTRPQSCTMAMVHCISSSEPDSADLNSQSSDQDWRRNQPVSTTPKADFSDITSGQAHYGKKSTPTHVAFAESSTLVSGLQYITEQMKSQEAVVSSRNYEKLMQHKRKSSDTLVVMETHHMHSSLFDDDEEVAN